MMHSLPLATRMRSLVSLSLIACVFVVAGCNLPRFNHERTEAKTIETEPLTKVQLVTFNGDVTVRTHDAPTVDVDIRYRGYGESEAAAEEACEQLTCDFVAEDGVLQILAQKPKDQWMASISFEVVVPSTCELDLKTSNGEVDIEGVSANVSMASSNGALRAKSFSGKLTAKTSNGRIEVEGVSGSVDLSTSNGRIELTGSIVGDANSLSTSNGRVKVQLPSTAAFAVDAKTSNGSIDCNFATQKISEEKKNQYIGVIGESSGEPAKLKIRTSNGSIDISELPQESQTPTTPTPTTDEPTAAEIEVLGEA